MPDTSADPSGPSSPGDERAGRDHQLHDLGAFIRAQRQLANLSLRQMADLAHVSNPYLSQLERGLHEPSVRVLQSIGRALNLSAETLLAHAGIVDDPADAATPGTEAAIRRDPSLSDDQKQALLSVYRSYVHGNAASGA
jgi:transcriptional regulator with XRE-family HTH domain